ncbi:MAG: tetratricopeptide repeat protein [Promethearchaeota archaeon]
MLDSIEVDIKRVKHLRDEAKFEEALELIRKLEESGSLSPRGNLDCQILKGEIISWLGKYDESIEILESAYQESQRIGEVTHSFDSLIFELCNFAYLNDDAQFHELIVVAEKIFKSIPKQPSKEYDRRRALFNYVKGIESIMKYELKKGVEINMISLGFYENSSDNLLLSAIYEILAYFAKYSANVETAIEYAEKCINLRKKLGNKALIARSFHAMGFCLLLTDLNQALKYSLRSLEIREELGNEIAIGESIWLIVQTLTMQGEFDQALEYGNRMLSLKDIRIFAKIQTLLYLGDIYAKKGEFDQALRNYERCLSLAREEDLKYQIAFSLQKLADFYGYSDYKRAIDYAKESLELFEDLKFDIYIVGCLANLTRNNVRLNLFDQAQYYLNKMQKVSEREGSKLSNQSYRLEKSRFLIHNTRDPNWAEAEKLLRELIEEDVTIIGITTGAILELCELLFKELGMSNDTKILEDINALISRMHKIAEHQHSFLKFTQATFFQAKVELLQADIGKARMYLTQAQQLAQKYGFRRLAQEISNQHDKLLDQQEVWEQMKERNVSISERMELASIDRTMQIMKEKQLTSEIVNETPVLLLIITQGGSLLFLKAFSETLTVEGDLISSFLSAFESFGDELFSERLDRIKFGENRILLKPLEDFSVCYLFKGQSYPALQKLTTFTKAIKENSEIWQALEKSVKTSEMLDLDNPPALKTVINEIF